MFEGLETLFNGTKKIFIFCIVIIILFMVLFPFTIKGLVENRKIVSDKIIKPKIELIIKDNKVDTLYVYENPKK